MKTQAEIIRIDRLAILLQVVCALCGMYKPWFITSYTFTYGRNYV